MEPTVALYAGAERELGCMLEREGEYNVCPPHQLTNNNNTNNSSKSNSKQQDNKAVTTYLESRGLQLLHSHRGDRPH